MRRKVITAKERTESGTRDGILDFPDELGYTESINK